MKFVKIIDDDNHAKEIPLLEWAELYSDFFVAYMVYPPYFFVKKFINGELLTEGMSGCLAWERFDFDEDDYCNIFKFFSEKHPSLKLCSGDVVHKLETMDDLSVWRQEIVFGIPFHEHQLLVNERNSLAMKLRSLWESEEIVNMNRVSADSGRLHLNSIFFNNPENPHSLFIKQSRELSSQTQTEFARRHWLLLDYVED